MSTEVLLAKTVNGPYYKLTIQPDWSFNTLQSVASTKLGFAPNELVCNGVPFNPNNKEKVHEIWAYWPGTGDANPNSWTGCIIFCTKETKDGGFGFVGADFNSAQHKGTWTSNGPSHRTLTPGIGFDFPCCVGDVIGNFGKGTIMLPMDANKIKCPVCAKSLDDPGKSTRWWFTSCHLEYEGVLQGGEKKSGKKGF